MSGGSDSVKARVRLAALLALACVLAACSSSGQSGPSTTGPTGTRTSVYFVTGAEGWPVARRAYKPRPDDPVTSAAEPTLDWYAEAERFPDSSHSEAVRLSGHAAPIAQLESSLAGFKLGSRQVHGLPARVGSGPDGPRVVLLPVAAGYTVMTLSYDLSIEELVKWSNALKAVDEPTWLAAGGVIAH